MIVDLILLVLQGVINIILAPLTLINIAVDFVSSIPVIGEFIQIVAYVLPWNNILPLVAIVVAVFVFRITLSIINFILKFIPFVG